MTRRSTRNSEPTTTITIRLNTATLERVDDVAERELRSRSAQIAKLLDEAVQSRADRLRGLAMTTLTTSSGRTLRLVEHVPGGDGQPSGWLVLVEGESDPEWRSTTELVRYLADSDNPLHRALAAMWATKLPPMVRGVE
jgi:hypothetical protein